MVAGDFFKRFIEKKTTIIVGFDLFFTSRGFSCLELLIFHLPHFLPLEYSLGGLVSEELLSALPLSFSLGTVYCIFCGTVVTPPPCGV